jgi:hypothetical protein
VKRSAALGFAYLVGALLWGCGSTPERETTELVALTDFGELTAQAVCALTFRCCSAGQRAGLPQAESECEAVLAADLNTELVPAIRAAVAAGQLRYAPERYASCLERVVSASCDTARVYVDCLAEGLVPLVPAGGRCGAQAHCADGACIGATSTTSGVCAEPLADGRECGSGFECASGACLHGLCEAPLAEGHSCYAHSECASQRCDGIAHVCARPSRAMCD